MMRWTIATSLKLRYLVVIGAAMLMFFGVLQLRHMPIDAYPEFAPPQIEVQTLCSGMSARDVEELVSVPLEQGLVGIEGLADMRSKSVSQLSSIVMIFKQGTDLMNARLLVQERITAMTPQLPRWANSPFMVQPLSVTSRAMKIGVTQADKSDAAAVKMALFAYWSLRPRLMRVSGVANVAIWGDRWHVKEIQVDPDLMKQHGVTLAQVLDSAGDAVDVGQLKFTGGFEIGTGGFVDTPNTRFPVQHQLPDLTPEQLATIPIEVPTGAKPVALRDVAKISEELMPSSLLGGDAVVNDGPGLMLIVEKLPWANTLQVTKDVEAAIKDFGPGMEGYTVNTQIFRPATFIQTAVDNLARSMVIGFILVVLILVLFLFEWRVALISTITIPLSLVAAGLVLYYSRATINTMILAGLVISLGVLVDDAIIDIENIVRRIRQYRLEGSTRSTASIILDASLEVRGPIVQATMIILVSTVPVFLLAGLTGSFFRPLALAYALAILASLLVALTVIPALALMLLSRARIERRGSPLVRVLQRAYTAFLARIVPRPLAAYALVGVVMAGGVAVTPTLGQDLFPAFKERDFLIHWITQPGTSREEMLRITEQVSRELRAIPGVQTFGSHIGQGTLADEIAGMNFGENWISIDPDVDYDKTLARVRKAVEGYPGLQRDVQTYLKERTEEVLTGASEAIVIRIYGDDLDVLRRKGDEVVNLLGTIPGIIEQHVTLQTNIPQVEVQVDLTKASKYGIKPGDVRRTAAAFITSEEAGDIWRNGRNTEVHVWSVPSARNSTEAVRNLQLDAADGSKVLMTSLAAGLALVPLAVAGSLPGHEIEHPMALVIIGGLVTSTLLNLFVVPSLYLRFGGQDRLGSRWRRYGARTAVRELSFTARPGDVVGLLGPNGSGKTTTIRLLTTVLPPTAGTFSVAGVPAGRPAEIRRRVGALPESSGYPGHQTGREYLRACRHPARGRSGGDRPADQRGVQLEQGQPGGQPLPAAGVLRTDPAAEAAAGVRR